MRVAGGQAAIRDRRCALQPSPAARPCAHLGLEVAVHHARLLVHEAHGRHEAAKDLARLGLAEVPLLADMLQQLPAPQQLQDQVRVQLRAAQRPRSPGPATPGPSPTIRKAPPQGHQQAPPPDLGPTHALCPTSRPPQEVPLGSHCLTGLRPFVHLKSCPSPRPPQTLFPWPSSVLPFHPQALLPSNPTFWPSQVASDPSHCALRPSHLSASPPSPSSPCGPLFRPAKEGVT